MNGMNEQPVNEGLPPQLEAADGSGAGGGARRRPVSRQARRLRGGPGVTRVRVVHLDEMPVRVPDYAAMAKELREKYKITVRKWRTRMTGIAYELTYQDGTIKRLISAPRPRSPVSAAIFLHEVGHHAIGFKRYESRCLEEHYVWQWTFREMEARGIPITPKVMRHFRKSMYHYVHQCRRLGEHVPAELAHFGHWSG